VKLQHAHIVPLECAFYDLQQNRGFLHFKRYEGDLAVWIEGVKGSSFRQPHRLGEPSEASVVDRLPMVLRIVHAMVQSVSHMHSYGPSGVVHGDLKPSNWLWDADSSSPLLCDFETAKDRGGEIGESTQHACTTTAPHLHTPKYTAPELEEDPRHPKTRQSD
ncbi:unnamed protein product, partial [Polarella glacialis]